MAAIMRKKSPYWLIGLAAILTACQPAWGGVVVNSAGNGRGNPPGAVNATPTPTPFQPEGTDLPPTSTSAPGAVHIATAASSPSPAPSSAPSTLWISGAVPLPLRQAALASDIPPILDPAAASIRLDVSLPSPSAATWIYALVAPFPTTVDGVSLNDIRNAWAGQPGGPFNGKPFRMDAITLAAFSTIWGPPAPTAVYVVAADRLLDLTWTERPIWAIVPFEALEPRWKVLTVDGQSPTHNDFNPDAYPLKISFAFQPSGPPLPATNRDPAKLTVLAMTGVTALVRATADRMEKNGVLYPGQAVRDVLRSADLVHISNEISFDPNCPTPNQYSESLIFCSDPKYIALLEDVHAKIIELTGNHLLDYSTADMLLTLQMYLQRGWVYYGGGMNLADAQRAVIVEDHGNRLAFLGCNPAGPVSDWATSSRPGSAPCDYAQMHAEIARLRSQGYVPIVTFQYNEYYYPTPTTTERADFRGMAEAGAEIVSGSQAHVPQAMEFDDGAFIHYGLGNLFFDQMAHLMPNGDTIYTTRQEFIDRYTIYDGKVISVELLTYQLEDYSRPRPMTPAERIQFLTDMFTASGW